MIRWVHDNLWRPLNQARKQWQDHDGHMLAAAISYYAAVSFFPLLLILISGLGFVLRFSGWGQDTQQRLLDFIAVQASEALAQNIQAVLADVQTKASIGGPVGIIALLLAAIAIFVRLENAFDRIWNVDGSRSKGMVATVRRVVFHRLKAFLMLCGFGVLIIATFVAGLTLSAIEAITDGVVPMSSRSWDFAEIPVTVLINWFLTTVIYKTLPKARVHWFDAARGGLLAAAIWEAGRQVLAMAVIGDQFSAYGLVGSFIAILLWVYYASAVLFIGAEYVQVLYAARSGGRGSLPAPVGSR